METLERPQQATLLQGWGGVASVYFCVETMNQEPPEPGRKPNEVPGQPDRPGNPDDPGRHPAPLPPDQEPIVPVREPVTPMPATDPQPTEPIRL